jgi:hypothetical protein
VLSLKSLILKMNGAQLIEFGRPISVANGDRDRFRMARELVAQSSLAGLHKLGRQGLSEILRSFFSLMKIREPSDFGRHFSEAMPGGVVKIIESAFHATGSRTMLWQFYKFYKDKLGKVLPVRKHVGRCPFAVATFYPKDRKRPRLFGQLEVLPVAESVWDWSGGPVLHKCVLRSTTFEVEYEGVNLLPPAPTEPEGNGLPVTWYVGQTEQSPCWTKDLSLRVIETVQFRRSKDDLRMGKR